MKPIERIAQLHDLGRKYADAYGDCEHLKHFRKSKLAILKIEYQKEDPKRSNIACEDLARANPEYLELLEGLKIATKISTAALWELRTSHAGINLYQTRKADERAELNIQSKMT